MANYFGLNATKRDNSFPSQKIAAAEEKGRIRLCYDEITTTALLLNGDTISFGKLPKNARVVDAILTSDDLGTTGSMSLGWLGNGVDAASAAGFLAAQDVHTAAIQASMLKTTPAVAGQWKKFGAETQVVATLTADCTANGTVRAAIFYVLD